MDIYKCKKCGERFLSCDLVRTKCSENECGAYMLTFCPKCFGKIEKEQEAVKPVLDEQTGRIWLCGKCGTYVGFEDNDPHDPNEFDKYCRECGRPVLWGGR